VLSFALITACFLVACAMLKLRYAEPDLDRPYRVPGGHPGIWLAILASAAVLLLMIVPTSPVYWPGRWSG
jgi:amino acid transporter